MKRTKREISKPLIWLFIFILAFLIGRASVPVKICPPCPPAKVEETISIDEKEIIEEINLARITNGVAGLKIHPLLEKSAQLKADDMARRKYFEHNTPDGKETWIFFEKVGYRYTHAGENLAKDFLSANGIVTAWLNSPSHKSIVLDPSYREIGVGQALWDSDIVIVAHFGRR